MFRSLRLRPLFAAGRDLLGLHAAPGALSTTPNDKDPFSITYADVCVTRAMLKAFGLPTEIVLEILEWAEYEPIRKFATTQSQTAYAPGNEMKLCLDAGILSKDILHSLSAGRLKVKIKEIEFLISSRDQGATDQGTDGTFNTSSWLEVSILRFDAPSLQQGSSRSSVISQPLRILGQHQMITRPQEQRLVARPEEAGRGIQDGEDNRAWYLQGNRVASRGRNSRYRVAWTADRHEGNEGAGDGLGFLQALRDGDRILVWARAKVSCRDAVTVYSH
jgi:hypothetical protein